MSPPTAPTRDYVERFARSYAEPSKGPPSDYAISPPAASLEYDAAPNTTDALPSDYAAGVVAPPTPTPATASRALSTASGPYCPLPERPTSPLSEDSTLQLERLVVDLLAVGQVGQAQAVALLLQQQRQEGDASPSAQELMQRAASATAAVGAAAPAYDAALQPGSGDRGPYTSTLGRPPTPQLRAAAIPVAKAAVEPPVGTSFQRVVATSAIQAPDPMADAVGTSFRAVQEGNLEGPVSASDDFDSEFWELAAVPPRAPGGQGPQIKGSPQRKARVLDAQGDGNDSLDALEARVAVALEEEAIEKERARKLQEQLQRTTAAVAELQVCVLQRGVCVRTAL